MNDDGVVGRREGGGENCGRCVFVDRLVLGGEKIRGRWMGVL